MRNQVSEEFIQELGQRQVCLGVLKVLLEFHQEKLSAGEQPCPK